MFNRLFRRPTAKQSPIVVVSGLPRSGTSLMMRMLAEGGIQSIEDGVRSADIDNPNGYFEHERVKALDKGDTAWLAAASGKAVKVISSLLTYLPSDYEYKILFMRRDLNEILASQQKMLTHRQNKLGPSDEEMKMLYRKHLHQVHGWLRSQANMQVLEVSFSELVREPMGQLPTIATFLDSNFDLTNMARVADKKLYRNRTPVAVGA